MTVSIPGIGLTITDASAGVTGGNGSANTIAPSLGAAPKLVQVAQRCGGEGQAVGSTAAFTTNHMRLLFPGGASAIQLVFPNFYNSAGELTQPITAFTAFDVTYTGGTGYAAGDIDTFAVTTSTGITAVKVKIMTVAAGVPGIVQIIDGGCYVAPLASGATPTSSGSGTGATATFRWKAGIMGMKIGIEPVWNQLVLLGAGQVIPVSKGIISGNAANYQSVRNTLLVPVDDFLVSDIMQVNIPVGGAIGLRMSFTTGNGQLQAQRQMITSLNPGASASANYEACSSASTFTDLSLSGTIGTTVTAGQVGYQPIAVLGIPANILPSVMAVADSRCVGYSTGQGAISSWDTMDTDGNSGWFEKALSNTTGKCYWPWSNLAKGGDVLVDFIQNGVSSIQNGRQRLQAIAAARPTAVYMGLNFNDINGSGQNLATMMSWENEAISMLKGMGVKYVFTDTTDPVTSSTDNWATTANQTQGTGSAVIIARNAALRAKTYAAYDFFIDNSPIVESSVGSGLWVVNGTSQYATGDGVHASGIIINLKAANAATVIAANVKV